MALVFPPEPAPEQAAIRPAVGIVSERDRRARNIGCAIVVLVFILATVLVFLLL